MEIPNNTSGYHGSSSTIGASIITNTILGVPCYKYSILYTEALFSFYYGPYMGVSEYRGP